ncbi:hypothetical protein EC9_37430 [Rosistilla ulvae]|uniref:J domain-containing protein n=1 Tax=Rosistilla ulvae TaxID=1930277 RepID=A0A517M3T0_9BACT|nr:hypothetical protein [Rosistilla ulvae]QDS89543.1 hypothetical protein EC9_37430 [Rosistilla ulvae]
MNVSHEQPAFDPYHTWLGIPPDQQPANMYRLLGLERFEANADVIDVAANRQVAYLRQVGVGDKLPFAKRLATEIADARRVLLDNKLRNAYDQQLRHADAGRPDDLAAPSFTIATAGATAVENRRPGRSANRRPERSMRRQRQRSLIMCGAAAVTVVVVLAGGYWVTRPRPVADKSSVATSDSPIESSARVRTAAKQPSGARLSEPVVARSKSQSISDAFDRKFHAAENSASAMKSKLASNVKPPDGKKPVGNTAALKSETTFSADIPPLLPIVVDFDSDAWREQLLIEDNAQFEKHHAVREGKLFVDRADDASYIVTPLHLKNFQLAAGESVSIDARIPKGLANGSGIVLQAGDFRLSLRVDSRETLLARTERNEISVDLAEIPLESDPKGLQMPYRLWITCPAADSSDYAWRIDTPSGESYRGMFDPRQRMSRGEVLFFASRYDARNSHFWIDNLRSDSTVKQPETPAEGAP